MVKLYLLYSKVVETGSHIVWLDGIAASGGETLFMVVKLPTENGLMW